MNDLLKVPKCFYRTSIKALVFDNEKRFLLCLEKSGVWELPGGGLDFGEMPEECLARELNEEMGVEVMHVNKRPSYFVSSSTSNGTWKTMVVYEAKVRNLNFKQSDECLEIRFFTKDEAKNLNIFEATKEFLKVFDPNNH